MNQSMQCACVFETFLVNKYLNAHYKPCVVEKESPQKKGTMQHVSGLLYFPHFIWQCRPKKTELYIESRLVQAFMRCS